ncbi:WD40/YVTN repeat-like-containing domain containing protein [Heracleum sosnowskyi]|uniref:WD40/YVTN repeat-like-containing domain containing protein n=1 Tax=Heracleum sosnowskyi TaxID=360622 RepID=A0AAD8J903_9APIA|nr:WD40/YVTN repeat-like-containing domain containing protein [Heracleum sosnowskyi]
MEARGIAAASPRARNQLRLVANKQSVGINEGLLNSVKMLQMREMGSKPHRCFSLISDGREKFRNIFLQEEYDTQYPTRLSATMVPFLERQTKVIEIVSAHGVVFALLESGICAAFSRDKNQRICFLNLSRDEVIRTIFYNKYIQRGQPDAGFLLFESESIKWPSYVEFNDLNAKLLTYSAQDRIYKVFELRNYNILYSISGEDVQDIKMSPGLMLLIYTIAGSHVPLKILSIADGSVVKSFNHLLHRRRKVVILELFNEKLLVKQENENLQILDVRTSELIEVSENEFVTPTGFYFLYESQLLLTFRDRTVAVWNSGGDLVTSYEDHLIWHPDSKSNIICLTNQNLIISYCKVHSNDRQEAEKAGSVNISNILTGKCLAKINAGNTHLLKECECMADGATQIAMSYILVAKMACSTSGLTKGPVVALKTRTNMCNWISMKFVPAPRKKILERVSWYIIGYCKLLYVSTLPHHRLCQASLKKLLLSPPSIFCIHHRGLFCHFSADM